MSPTRPSLSIIVPVHNEEATIGSTLEHLEQLEGDHETIVVDGGSEDATVEIARRYVPVLFSERGRAVQMNRGAEAARGEVLLFLHADTRLPPRALAAIGKTMSDPTVIGGRFRVRLDSPRWVFRLIEGGINLRDRLFRGFTGDQAIFIRSSLFRELGGYRPLAMMEDLDLGRRMCRQGKVVRLPLAVSTSARRWERDGVLRTVVRMWVLRYLYLLGVSPTRLRRFYADTR